MSDSEAHKIQTMIEIAKLYYLDGMSQDAISKQLHMSRSNISRLLARAIEAGIVQITVNDSRFLHPDVSRRIAKKFGLDEVIIAATHSDTDRTRRKIAEAAAAYFSDNLRNGTMLGITRGRTSYNISRLIHNNRGACVDVVQMMGCTVNVSPIHDSYMLAEAFARRLNGRAFVLPVPLMTKSKQLRDMLLLEPICSETVEQFSKIEVALLEISSLSVRLSSQFREPWITKADSLQLEQVNAVASVCGHYFDKRGLPCNAGINERIIAADRATIMRIPTRLGIAFGSGMLESTVSILRSRMVNVLITDESLAFDIDSSIC